ncbi:NCS1 nucleoside transporter [Seiridium cupressi]
MGIRLRLPRTFKSLDVSEEGHNSRWANPDVLPVPKHQINYDWKAYAGYWLAVGFNTTCWSLGSSNLANGLDAGATIGAIAVGFILAALVAFVSGEPAKCFVNFIFFGIQSYWGGLAANIVLSAIFPSFRNLANTIPGFIIYIIIFTSMMFIHPSKLSKYVWISQAWVTITMVSLFIWAMSQNHGASFLGPSKTITSSERSFRILQAISAVAGSWTGSCIRQADWTRYTKSRTAVAANQLITGPIAGIVCATMGIAVTSAMASLYPGSATGNSSKVWNPITLLDYLQTVDYSATTRAGTFFAGLGFFISQITVNLVQNSVACGMDLASMAPKYIDVTRGSLIMCLVGYLIQPWRFVNQAGLFISVLNSFGMFVSPLAGINAVDFWLVRRLKWKIPDLYKGSGDNIYWYTAGLNWRAFAAWIITVWASFPGFIAAMNGKDYGAGWTRTFQVTWIVGFCGSGLVYYLVCLVSPPPGAPYVLELLDEQSQPAIEGQSVSEDETGQKRVFSTGATDVENGKK